MDSQTGVASSLLVSLVLEHPGLQENADKLWTNAQFQFLLDICEEKLWEYNWKPFREANWKDLTNQLNAHFLGVHQSWKQMCDKWSKMKDETEKKIQVIGASPSDWPWSERFDQMFGSTTKINGIANAID
jgi:hypothetical protein